MPSHLKEFARSLESISRIGKKAMRQHVFELFSTLNKPSYNIITLPSIYWVFEKSLLLPTKKKVNLHCFEMNWELFCIASLKMPRDEDSMIRQIMEENLNYQKMETSFDECPVTLHHLDVFDYLKNTNIMFDFLWLDLTCSVDVIHEKLKFVAPKMKDDSILILSFMKGRERFKIIDRCKFVRQLLPDLKFVECIEYRDTITMVNIIFRKTTTLDVEQLVEASIVS